MDPTDLARWTRFAVKGGIGKCTALCDCVAERDGDLMFLKHDEITVLMQLPDKDGVYLGYCEGVVGRFRGADVQFHGKLKRPVMTKRSSVNTAKSPSPHTSMRRSVTLHSPVIASTDDEKPSLPSTSQSAPSLSFDSASPRIRTLSPLNSTPGSFSVEASPVDSGSPSTGELLYSSLLSQRSPSPQLPKTVPQLASSPPLIRSHSIRFSRDESPQTKVTPPEDDGPGNDTDSLTAPQEPSYATYEDPSTRVSVAYSDGEVGIGLTMLQALINGDDDDDDDDWSQSSMQSISIPHSQANKVTNGDHGNASSASTSEPVLSDPSEAPSRSPSPSASAYQPDSNSQEYDTTSRRPSLAPSAVSTSSWEGASDIYDDYRYSRYSMASRISRLSVMATGGIGMSSEQPPPVPDPRPSVDSRPGLDLRPGMDSRPNVEAKLSVEAIRGPPRTFSLDPEASVIQSANRPRTSSFKNQNHLRLIQGQRVPPAERSPLLHTNWGSPMSSAVSSPMSTNFSPALQDVSSSSSISVSTPPPHDEVDSRTPRASQSEDNRTGDKSSEGLGRQIVVEDDEEFPSQLISSTLYESPSSSPEPNTEESQAEQEEPARELVVPKIERQSDDPVGTPLPVNSPSFISSLAPSEPSNYLRPSLSDLRGEPIPGSNKRQSLFLPHPNAPKAPPMSSAGPMYIQSPQETPSVPPIGPIRPNSAAVILMSLSRSPPLPSVARGGFWKGPTVYGRTEIDLSSSPGPVPIIFSIDPPPLPSPLTPGFLHLTHVPIMLQSSSPLRRPATAPHNGLQPGTDSAVEAQIPLPGQEFPNIPDQQDPPLAIPRPNFFPRTPGTRPRSRSFSGFDSTIAEITLPVQKSSNDLDGANSFDLPTVEDIRRSLSSMSMPSSAPPSPTSPASPTPSLSVGSKPMVKTSPLRPSPLSLPENSVSRENRDPGSITSPKPPLAPLNHPSSPPLSASSGVTKPLKSAASKLNLSDSPNSRSPVVQSPARSGSLLPNDPIVGKVRPSVDTDVMSISSDSRSFLTNGLPTIVRQNSLRSKLSLPNLRRKNKQDETSSLGSGSQAAEVDTVQVKDMDFELVRPNIPQLYPGRNSEDSGVLGRDGFLDAPGSLHPPDSPVPSTFSASSPTVSSDAASWHAPRLAAPNQPSPLKTSDNEQMIDAHRQREQKWVAVMSSVQPSQSRKSKKVKKLLLDGVPASVRYLVWSHVTDGRARIVAGVYARLGSRGRVPASELIEKDLVRYFKEYPQLQGLQSPVLVLLQAYMSMVPDVQYSAGLTLIVGQLLLQGPEEEVFWIFVSLMDSYLRPYFSFMSQQLEVDSALFGRALEANDGQVAKKVLLELSIPPSEICSSWFTSVFVENLPTGYVNRVWDLFMYEGIPFLMRVGLAIINCCRRILLECTSDASVLEVLHHPPSRLLPPNPDALVTLALSQKLKDDDVRKQRIKMEAQVKRQTQAQQAPRKTAAAPASISLPKT